MAKQRPIRNSEIAGNENIEARRSQDPDLIFGVPRHRLPLIVLFFGVTIGSFVVWGLFQRPPMLDEYTYEVVDEFPHDMTSFTQGLIFHKGHVYESTGLYGQSKLRKLNLDGDVLKEVALDPEYFGEGLALVDDKLIQLTWKENKAFVYDLDLNKIAAGNRVLTFCYDTGERYLSIDGFFPAE